MKIIVYMYNVLYVILMSYLIYLEDNPKNVIPNLLHYVEYYHGMCD